MRLLVTGGGGYVGTSLVPILLSAGHKVTVLDPLYRGGLNPLLPFFRNPAFRLIRCDMSEEGAAARALEDCDAVIHLAAVVGYPACAREPERTEILNIKATEILCRYSADRPFIFASTGSCYGAVADKLCTEESPLQPLSLYGSSKVEGEKIVGSITGGVSLRFATAYGLSPVMRTDLLMNHLTMQAVKTGRLSIYEPEAHRTFIHVSDMAKAFLFALDNYESMAGEAWNVGDESQNLTKRDICLKLKNLLPELYLDFLMEGKDPDARDYAVSYEKLRSLGYRIEIPLDDGMSELIRAFSHFQD